MLPFEPPLAPMLAKRATKIPKGDHWLFEPKWDGFRTLIFRDGDEVYLQSRDKKPLLRYFPDLEAPLLAQLPERCVLDGEIVIPGPDGLDFNALQLRIHPAESRVNMLAEKMPACVVVWDLLALGDEDLREVPLQERRGRLEEALSAVHKPVYVTPATTDRELAADWFTRFEGAGLDGILAKPVDGTYEPGKRAMVKVKHVRTCECVVAGFRWYKGHHGELVGSLLLGLYDDDGRLHHIGIAGSFTRKLRAQLVEDLAPYRDNALAGHPWREWAEVEDSDTRMPGSTSRWSRDKSLHQWVPVRLERVCEVKYGQLLGKRFRHPAYFLHGRHDKPVEECRYDQLDETPPYEFKAIFLEPTDP